jgi:outer membrane immunogenic protein
MKPLRQYFLATTSSAALIGAAAAADMPMVTKAPPAPAVAASTWAGPYLGLNAGAAFNHSEFTDVDFFFFLLPVGPGDKFWTNTHAGLTAGGLAGYNLQFGNLVIGAEADLNAISAKSSANIPSPIPNVVASSNVPWMATVRGRAGVTIDNSTLLYGAGGVAIARFSDSWGIAGNPFFTVSNNYQRTGWTAGGGVERMLSAHWTARVEALYADFGTNTTFTTSAGLTYRTLFQHSVTLARAALSYKW